MVRGQGRSGKIKISKSDYGAPNCNFSASTKFSAVLCTEEPDILGREPTYSGGAFNAKLYNQFYYTALPHAIILGAGQPKPWTHRILDVASFLLLACDAVLGRTAPMALF